MTAQRLFSRDMTFLVLLKKKQKNLSVNFEFRYNCILSECFADVAIFISIVTAETHCFRGMTFFMNFSIFSEIADFTK